MHAEDPTTVDDLVANLLAALRETSGDPVNGIQSVSILAQVCQQLGISREVSEAVAREIKFYLDLADRHNAFPVAQRAESGRLMGWLGDPRADINAFPPATVFIPEGEFHMGHEPDPQLYDVPSLQSGVYSRRTPAYRIGRYPVTNSQYRHFVDAGGYAPKAQQYWSHSGWAWRTKCGITVPAFWGDPFWCVPNHPVVGVSWFEAAAYCQWLTETTGRVFRLPAEPEWERAAGHALWPWGNVFDGGRANTAEGRIGRTTAVGLYLDGANADGVHDLCGNVWEWCNSEFRGYGPYHDDDRERPEGVAPRCIRGGSWLNNRDRARSANRDHYFPADRHYDLGFRVVELLG
jgi:formylglycine-generating enzyme required for sulfatase activity